MTNTSELNGQLAGKPEKVWVGVRVRPLLQQELDAKETVAWRASDLTTLKCLAEEKGMPSHQQKSVQQNAFLYDRVFADSCTSEEVYAVAAQPMVQSAMEGYNCTLFAYGQTGSGKTTTMRSVMRHGAKDIFAHISRTRDRDFVLKMCAIEVYNEVVHDLFVDADTNLKINDDKEKGPVVVDLTEQSIESEEHLVKMLKAVEARRTVRETKMNQKSSRSHLVVRLYVESRPALASENDASSDDGSLASDDSSAGGGSGVQAPRMSTINFVDLAGSERLTQASMTDDADKEKLRQKEASNINVSLLTLGKVIRSLGSKRGEHVPYRESNLTRILQPSLSGNCRMAIVCTLSPASGSVENTRGALHFANHARNVTMRPVLNEVRDEQALIHKMEVEIADLRRKLGRMDRPERSSRQGTRALLAEKDAELKAKEEQMQQALLDRKALERKLGQIEKFIIRGGSGSPAQGMRRSFDGIDALQASMAGGGGGPVPFGRGGSSALGAAGAGVSVRASWNPSSSSPLDARERTPVGAAARIGGMGRSVAHPRLLLQYLLPPGVREAVNKLGGSPILSRPSADTSAATGLRGTGGSQGMQRQSCVPGFNLRAEIGKLQAPEGSKAQEALTALRAEVSCYSQQPAAAAAVAAAAGATPDTADLWLDQLNQMLANMEQRQVEQARLQSGAASGADGSVPVPAVPHEAPTAVAAAAPEEGQQGSAVAATVDAEKEKQAERLGQGCEDEDGLMTFMRSEVARLERMQAVNVQTNQAIESLLSKVAKMEQAGGAENPSAVAGFSTQAGGVQGVLDRLQTALQEVDVLEEGDEEGDEDEQHRHPMDADGKSTVSMEQRATPHGTPVQRRRGSAVEDGEATSGRRYDSPAAMALGANVLTATTAGAPFMGSPARLSGTKLPRALLTDAECGGSDGGAAAILKSPRRSLMASPHSTAVTASVGPTGLTPNSRATRLSASMSASMAGIAQAALGNSPRAVADVEGPVDDMGLRRMRTPSLSMHASDGEPMSGGQRTASASSRGLLRSDTERAKRIISREKDAIHAWYAAEVARLKSAFHKEAQGNVDSMREALEGYRGAFNETQERLNLQKKLLMQQVLQLELAVNEAEQQEDRNNEIIAQLTAERDHARYEAAQAKSRAQAALQQAQRAQLALAQASENPATPNERPAFLDDDDGWADAPAPEMLLSQICELWHKLHVPIVYRSRFYMLFRAKEPIYLNMEQRRLQHRLVQVEREQQYMLTRSKTLDKAKRALELERKVLSHAMGYTYNEAEREALYVAWGVRPASKGRKLQVVKMLWGPTTTKDQAGMETCAEMVCALAGPDATEQFMQLVFGNTAEALAQPTPVGALMSTLVRRVTTPRQRKSTTPTGGGATATAAPAASAGNYTNASGAPGAGGVTPRRTSTSVLANLAGRVGSFLSRDTSHAASGRMSTAGLPPQVPTAPLAAGTAAGALNAGAASAAGPTGASTPRHTPVGFASPPPHSGVAAAAGMGDGMGPMVRGLASNAVPSTTPLPSARGPGVPPLPPPHPNTALGTPPVSARGQPTYAGLGRL